MVAAVVGDVKETLLAVWFSDGVACSSLVHSRHSQSPTVGEY